MGEVGDDPDQRHLLVARSAEHLHYTFLHVRDGGEMIFKKVHKSRSSPRSAFSFSKISVIPASGISALSTGFFYVKWSKVGYNYYVVV